MSKVLERIQSPRPKKILACDGGGILVGSGNEMFDQASLFKRLHYSYHDEPLAAKLRTELNRALGGCPAVDERGS